MTRKPLALLPLGVVAALVAFSWSDIVRYVKIKQLDLGRGGHPETVPAEGRTTYPQHSRDGVLDGSGDFASAGRGGPA